MEDYSATTKNEAMPFAATRIDPEAAALRRLDGEGAASYDTPYVWALKRNDTHELTWNRSRLTDLETELTVPEGRMGAGSLGSTGSHCCF